MLTLTSAYVAASTVSTQTIIKSPNDQREYYSTTLSNKLTVLLISDPETDKASAALDVNIGSSDDPAEFLGLAHFLEHMLFLGTKKFPNPDEYQKYISDHGGSHNAFTSLEHTNYFFDINANNLESALDRFSEQFTSPLFNAEYIEREVNAVHSEYSSKLKDDGRRFFSAIKSILSKDHPYKKFSVGNLETLKDQPDKSLREAVVSFYNARYSANEMKLVIFGKEPIPTLKKWAEEKFSNIPNHNVTTQAIKNDFFDEEFLPAKIEVNSIMDTRSMTIAFPVPSAFNYKNSQPISYLSNLIGHEGSGSLLSELKSQQLVDSLSAGAQFDTNQQAMFMITMRLTEQGLTQQESILKTVFSYFELLRSKGIQKDYFDEQAQMLKISFRYQEKLEPIHLTSALAGALHDTDATNILFEGYNLNEYTPDLYLNYLNHLTPENMLVTISANNIKGNSKTEWYEAPYNIEKYSDEFIHAIKTPKTIATLTVPEKNIFIPENIDLLTLKNNQQPELLKRLDGLEIWYSANTSFGTPKANLFVTIRSPATTFSAANLNLTEIMVSLLKDSLNEFSYPAYLAGLHYELYNHIRGITVKISGYNDKQSILLNKILLTLKYNKFTEERFAIIKERLQRKLLNAKDKKPYEQAIAEVQHSILSPSWSEQERLEILTTQTLRDLESFRLSFFKTIDTAILSSGNISRSSALNIGKQFESIVLSGAEAQAVERSSVYDLSGTQAWYKNIPVEHPDTGFVYYIQGNEKSFEEQAMFLLLNQIISTDYYAQIRTKKQLGYIVFATNFNLFEVPGLAFIVQSPNSDGETLLIETELFLQEQALQLQKITPDMLAKYQSAVTTRLLKNDNTLYQRSNRNWQEIDKENFNFNTKNKLADAVNNTTKKEVLSYFNKLIMNKGNSLLVYTKNKATENEEPEASEALKNLTPLSKDILLKTFSGKE
jgi:secreted Zn-dependent insulinase-like peptidase